ncbi:MAG: family 16 glycosylhydrolase [Bacteroidota bacterium]
MKFYFSLFFILSSILLMAQCPNLVWADEFEGNNLDGSKWSHQTGDGCPNLCGWGNNELQWYKRENTVVEDGKLKIIAKREQAGDKNYTSSRIRSINKGDWKYGRFEASIKLPKGQGIWPAFWMLPTDEVYGGWPQSGEIDIVEMIGKEPATAHGTIHFGNAWPNNRSSGAAYELLEGILNDEFHEFAIEWEENEIRWFVDDYLYATKNRSDVAPARWPFDQDFHFLLNVAVGGNWPGSPNTSTPFPQNMEVEYVRVYDGFSTYITGKREVAALSENLVYTVHNTSENATIDWKVPEGVQILEGQGTPDLRVNWGTVSGEIEVEITDDCGKQNIVLEVAAGSAIARDFSFENFDETARVQLNFTSGDFEDEANNPDTEGINASNLVGKYKRNAAALFDIIVYQINDLGNVFEYINGTKKFYLDLYTDAPIGTTVLLQLEDSRLVQSDNYPRGRHSRFEVTTSKQNEWERFEFQFKDRPDVNVSNTRVDQFVLLFASNTNSGDTFIFDNFDSYAPVNVSTKEIAPLSDSIFQIAPNPANNYITLNNLSSKFIKDWQILDYSGNLILIIDRPLAPKETIKTNFLLPNGTYILQAVGKKGILESQKLIVKK